jgi:hypothetical protein
MAPEAPSPERPIPVPERPDREPPKRTANQRAQAVLAALDARGPGPFTIHTPAGSVTLDRVEVVTVDGIDVVEVHAANPESGDPHFRVINPPRYVPDPDGDVTMIGPGGRFREDPIAALAHLIAQHGGRHKDPRRGR